MEKSWENFWTTGKVEDYLSYKNGITEKEEKYTSGIVESTGEREKGTQRGLSDRWDSR